jgi:hypothetical protein
MKPEWAGGFETPYASARTIDGVLFRLEPSVDSVLTGDALRKVKAQAPEGCVLCSFDVWDDEEWD